ncbi:MAG: hypothetical protein WC829_02145 [Hyphomicrobium sp.]|jgi:hypothetical protein
MSSWDELTEAQKRAISAHNRRHHSSANREARLRAEDARTLALNQACDWLLANGHADAGKALESAFFEGVG